MKESFRPFTKHEKRMWELEYKPWAYEYHVDPAPLPEMVKEPERDERAGFGLFLLALLFSIMDLPDPEELSIDRLKLETPQSKTGKS